jgi:hypothetical protein
MYNLYSSAAAAVNSAGVNPNWQLARSPPQQQQQQPQQQSTDQQRGYGNGQNVASQQAASTGASNTGGRSASTSGPSGQTGVGPPLTPQYTLNGAVPAAYAAYGAPAGWIPGPPQVPSPQTNIPPQMNAAYNVMFDPSQQISSQQPTYVHQNPYDASAYYSQQSQQQQQQQPQQQQPPPPPPQQGVDTVQQGNYNR